MKYHQVEPWSFTVNIATVVVLFAMAIAIDKKNVWLVATAIIIFELFHAFSHAAHLPGHIQQYIIHSLTYLIAAALLWTRGLPNTGWHVVAGLLVALDLWLLLSGDMFHSVISGVGILFLTLYGWMPIGVLLCLGIIGVILLVNEKYRCSVMLAKMRFPYHIFIEFVASASFIWLVWLVSKHGE